ncbi:NUMOD4 motif-containing HNH endonuclease [Clostridium botulinum]|uniref:NUMOD4 motif-containing HNH endonuclease n=1 Tax=Clostridium botulinum TaxID=1491 RepID=UPI00192CE7AC|nr:NUMOD4 motif-containing HNH endonuclease [Clostridium botulinum]
MIKIKLYSHQELWKDIKGYEGLYQVSNLGRVKSLMTTQSRRSGILKSYNHSGYRRINLYKNGKGKKYYIHRLVAEVFIQNVNNYPEINHIDGNKSNNVIDNLEWCTSSQNQIHAFKIGLQRPNLKVHLGNNYRGIKCQLINNISGEVSEFEQMKKASEFLGHHKTFIYRKSKKQGNSFISDGYTIKVGDAICHK